MSQWKKEELQNIEKETNNNRALKKKDYKMTTFEKFIEENKSKENVIYQLMEGFSDIRMLQMFNPRGSVNEQKAIATSIVRAGVEHGIDVRLLNALYHNKTNETAVMNFMNEKRQAGH